MYYEGEYTTGEAALQGRGGALYYMPTEFERDVVWTSNGKFTGQQDVIDAWAEGAGFLFLSGHGSPNVGRIITRVFPGTVRTAVLPDLK